MKPLAVTSVFGTKRIFNEMMQEKGGLTKIRSPADVPRNREQIRNFRKNSASTVSTPDDLTVVMYKCKEQSKNENEWFIREVCVSPEMHVFLCNRIQLNDLIRFCCNDVNTSIFGVDMTFNIGEY